jgi:O-antigen ligase
MMRALATAAGHRRDCSGVQGDLVFRRSQALVLKRLSAQPPLACDVSRKLHRHAHIDAVAIVIVWETWTMSSVPAASAENTRVPLSDHIVGTVFLIAAAATVVAGRSTAFLLPVLTLLVLVLAYLERNSFRGFLQPVPASVPVAIFLAFAILSSAWSAEAGATLAYTATILLIFLQWHVVNHWLSLQPMRRIRHLAFWLVIAVLIGLALLLHEVFAEQYIRRLLVDNFGILAPPGLNRHYWIDESGNLHIHSYELNRSIAALNLYLWPAVLCALSFWSGRKLAVVATLLIGGAILATMGSDHETSKLAIVTGIACFLVAWYWRRAAFIGVVSLWVVLCLVAVPAAHFAHDGLALHEASWLQRSAKHRIQIWDDVADHVAEAPILGMGARTAYVLDSKRQATAPPAQGEDDEAIARHAHNIYLQNWFELGIVGALLFLVAGLAVLSNLRRIPERAQPFALATFAVFMVEIASSWEIWQRWFASLFALVMIFLALGIRSLGDQPETS